MMFQRVMREWKEFSHKTFRLICVNPFFPSSFYILFCWLVESKLFRGKWPKHRERKMWKKDSLCWCRARNIEMSVGARRRSGVSALMCWLLDWLLVFFLFRWTWIDHILVLCCRILDSAKVFYLPSSLSSFLFCSSRSLKNSSFRLTNWVFKVFTAQSRWARKVPQLFSIPLLLLVTMLLAFAEGAAWKFHFLLIRHHFAVHYGFEIGILYWSSSKYDRRHETSCDTCEVSADWRERENGRKFAQVSHVWAIDEAVVVGRLDTISHVATVNTTTNDDAVKWLSLGALELLFSHKHPLIDSTACLGMI